MCVCGIGVGRVAPEQIKSDIFCVSGEGAKKKKGRRKKGGAFGSHYNNLTATLPGLEGCQCRSRDHFVQPAC